MKNSFTWRDENSSLRVYCDAQAVGAVQPYRSDNCQAEDTLREIGDGVFELVRRFRFLNAVNVETIRLSVDFVAEYRSHYAMIPAVSYNGNPWEPGKDPKGLEVNGDPWSFAYHRTAVAGGTYSEGPTWAVALFGKSEHQEVGFSCSLILKDSTTVHRITWPEEEAPLTYVARDRYEPGYCRKFAVEPGQDFVATVYIVIERLSRPVTGWHKFLDVAWTQNHHRGLNRFSPDQIWQLGIEYAKESLWAEEGVFRGFSIGLRTSNNIWEQNPSNKYEIGWCGQNASLANSLLFDYLLTQNTASLEKGLATLDTWVSHARLGNGLFRCHFDAVLSGNQVSELQDTCNLGWAASEFFEAHELARQCAQDRVEYLATALAICDFFVAHQFPDGNLGKAWTNAGTCVDLEGTTGAFLIPPLMEAYTRTGRSEYLGTARKAYDFYSAGLLRNGFTTAGALDTYCIDKESAIPLLDAGLRLFELEQDQKVLELAEHAAYYLASWQWHHSVAFPEASVLHALNYDTFGGTSVSTQHHHLDPYGLAFVRHWLRLADLTGKAIWRERAVATWTNGMIGMSDGSLILMGKQRPAGSQDEAFFHTRWGGGQGNVSEWLVAWPTALRLEVLRKQPDWSILQ